MPDIVLVRERNGINFLQSITATATVNLFLDCIAQNLDFIYHQCNMELDFSPLHQWLVIGTLKESQIMSGIHHLSESD